MTNYFKRSNQLPFVLALKTSFKDHRLETDMRSTRNGMDPVELQDEFRGTSIGLSPVALDICDLHECRSETNELFLIVSAQ
jgi:hypothetical protein